MKVQMRLLRRDFRPSRLPGMGLFPVVFACFLCLDLAAQPEYETMEETVEALEEAVEAAEEAVTERRGVTYEVRLEGVEEGSLRNRIISLSDTFQQQEQLPASVQHLRRRVDRDVQRFQQILREEGYYGGQPVGEIGDPEVRPVEVVFHVDRGPRYTFGELELQLMPWQEEDPPPLPSLETLGLRPGDPALPRAVIEAESAVIAHLRNHGHPLATVPNREAFVDHESRTMDLLLPVAVGPRAVFGPLNLEGLDTVEERVVLRLVPWQQGELFQQAQLDTFQSRLYDTALFSMVRLAPEDAVTNGEMPITLEVTERKHRTISAGISYTTDFGLGVQGDWEHRNIHGLGRRLTLEARLNKLLSEFSANYHVPRFRRDNQSLTSRIEVARERTDAFDSDRIVARIWAERRITERLAISAGLGLRVSHVEQLGRETDFYLVSVPLGMTWDNSNDPLNPTRGTRISLSVTPFVGDAEFVRNELIVTHYHPLDEDAKWVLAGRLRLGSIAAYGLDKVPPDVRFYSGGGGSVRGYPYQSIGPVVGDDPLGGRSVLEAALELRRQLTDRLGVVGFVDGGSVTVPAILDLNERFRVSVGGGVRYFSPLGPLRVDLAVPVNPPSHVDSWFQIYLSIGQAF